MRKNKREELKDKLRKGQSSFRDEKAKLKRIIDSEEEDFVSEDHWAQTRNELARQVHKLLVMLQSNNTVQVSKEYMGFGVPVRH